MFGTLTVGAAMSGSAGAVNLVNNLFTFIKAAQKAKQTPRLAEILARIPGEAFSLAEQYVTEIQDLRLALLKAGIDLDQSQRDSLLSMSPWRFEQRRLLTKFAAKVNGIEMQLSRFMDDALSVADCCGGDAFIVESFAAAEEMRTLLHEETDPRLPLGTILSALEKRAGQLKAALGDMTRVR